MDKTCHKCRKMSHLEKRKVFCLVLKIVYMIVRKTLTQHYYISKNKYAIGLFIACNDLHRWQVTIINMRSQKNISTLRSIIQNQ